MTSEVWRQQTRTAAIVCCVVHHNVLHRRSEVGAFVEGHVLEPGVEHAQSMRVYVCHVGISVPLVRGSRQTVTAGILTRIIEEVNGFSEAFELKICDHQRVYSCCRRD